MSKSLVFELGCEDLPALQIGMAIDALKDGFISRCKDARIELGEVKAYASPRRLALLVDSVAERQSDLETLKVGLAHVAEHDSLLTLGMRPTRPETGYGYIQLDNIEEKRENAVLPVKTFTEKPNAELAKVFFESGEFLWNSGIFLWNIRAIRKAFRAHQPSIADVFKRGDELMNTPEEEAWLAEADRTGYFKSGATDAYTGSES